MYIDKIKINDFSDKLSNETIEKISTLIFENNKMKKFKIHKNLVSNNLKINFRFGAAVKKAKYENTGFLT